MLNVELIEEIIIIRYSMQYKYVLFSLLLVLALQEEPVVLLSSNLDNTMIVDPPGLTIGLGPF